MSAGAEGNVFDVAVIGAGPAGSATARMLALRGCRVALVERTHFEAPRIGESLAPNVQQPLRELGVWPEFLALAPLPSWGTCSLWGSPAQESHSHMLSPHGCGWHVDRRAFDTMLARAATASGASLFEGVTLGRSLYRQGLWWLQTAPATVNAERQEEPLRARVLVDATGRNAHLARSLGARRALFDTLVGVVVYWEGVAAAEQGHLVVETAREGWWYSAPLPDSTQPGAASMVSMLMTDADLCTRSRLTSMEHWQASLGAARATSRRLGLAHRTSLPRVHCARSHRLLRNQEPGVAGPWLAVGEAAMAVDPISGSGVLRALHTARAAADTVGEMLAQPHDWRAPLSAYETQRDAECTTYLLERARYYGAEQRYDTPFWQRRQVMARIQSPHRS